ncbi:hypothetical protein D920_00925 [Enterococcus faecalis 13-SD-W-01]|nr:hypothetical protein D920_00925 [Enterococcus faecalis 13-SD-W-01]
MSLFLTVADHVVDTLAAAAPPKNHFTKSGIRKAKRITFSFIII